MLCFKYVVDSGWCQRSEYDYKFIIIIWLTRRIGFSITSNKKRSFFSVSLLLDGNEYKALLKEKCHLSSNFFFLYTVVLFCFNLNSSNICTSLAQQHNTLCTLNAFLWIIIILSDLMWLIQLFFKQLCIHSMLTEFFLATNNDFSRDLKRFREDFSSLNIPKAWKVKNRTQLVFHFLFHSYGEVVSAFNEIRQHCWVLFVKSCECLLCFRQLLISIIIFMLDFLSFREWTLFIFIFRNLIHSSWENDVHSPVQFSHFTYQQTTVATTEEIKIEN